MPDNSTKIADLEASINAGALSVRIDDTTVEYRSLADMRSIVQQLIDADTSGDYTARQNRRPLVARINLGGF